MNTGESSPGLLDVADSIVTEREQLQQELVDRALGRRAKVSAQTRFIADMVVLTPSVGNSEHDLQSRC